MDHQPSPFTFEFPSTSSAGTYLGREKAKWGKSVIPLLKINIDDKEILQRRTDCWGLRVEFSEVCPESAFRSLVFSL
jgi:hypothetical protein